MMKRLYVVLLLLCVMMGVYSQVSNGFIGGINYMNYDHTVDDESYEPGIGVSIGYRLYWQLSPRWDIGGGLSVNKYNIVTTYYSELHTQTNKDENLFLSIPINADFHVYRNICLTAGYQYSRLYDRETSDANLNDHALLLGCNYQLPFCHLQLIWQKSLNAESETRSYYGDTSSAPDTYTHYYHKIDGFHLLVYIPLNKRKDKKD